MFFLLGFLVFILLVFYILIRIIYNLSWSWLAMAYLILFLVFPIDFISLFIFIEFCFSFIDLVFVNS